MKKFLLIAGLSFTIAGQAQLPIAEFQGIAIPVPEGVDGFSSRTYYRGVFETAPDESATGAGAAWDFSSVTFGLAQNYITTNPTDAEVIAYPGTNFVTTAFDEPTSAEVGKLFANKTNDGNFFMLGNNGEMFSLTFSGDGALVGQFPMSYEALSTDAVSGTFVYTGPEGNFSGNFTGTMTSTYDAYGTIEYVLDNTETSANVNRLSVVLDLTFGTTEFPSAGTLTQTSNYYYDGVSIWPSLRSVTSHFMVPLLNVDQNTTYLEKATDAILTTPETGRETVKAYPNPVKNLLTISGFQNQAQINVTDLNGRSILNQTINAGSIDLSSLQTGMYMVRISTEAGTTIKKIIKQ